MIISLCPEQMGWGGRDAEIIKAKVFPGRIPPLLIPYPLILLLNLGKTVFAQLMKFLPIHKFRQCVQHYRGTYKVQTFSCWDQFLCLAFAQLTYRESL